MRFLKKYFCQTRNESIIPKIYLGMWVSSWFLSAFCLSTILVSAASLSTKAYGQIQHLPDISNCGNRDTVSLKIGQTILDFPISAVTISNLWMRNKEKLNLSLSCSQDPIPMAMVSGMAKYILPDLPEGILIRNLDIVSPNFNVASDVANLICAKQQQIIHYKHDGVEFCIESETADKIINHHTAGRFFVLNQSKFPTLSGRNVAFYCDADAPMHGLHWCTASVEINTDIQINIEFYPPPTLWI
jgi:hypothetical protein